MNEKDRPFAMTAFLTRLGLVISIPAMYGAVVWLMYPLFDIGKPLNAWSTTTTTFGAISFAATVFGFALIFTTLIITWLTGPFRRWLLYGKPLFNR